MGEEEKKPEEKKPEEKKPEEAKKVEEEKKDEAKKGGDEKKPAAPEESKDGPPPAAAEPPPPQEIILQVYMHCEGCARKVRRSLIGFEGVEEVVTDCKTSKVVVKGDKADPLKVLERVQRKSHRQVQLLSPIPKPPPPEEPKKVEEKEAAKPEEKKEEPQVIIAVLKVYMHCEACAQQIKRGIEKKMKGVSAEPDLKSSEVTVKGVFEPPKLVDFIRKRTGKRAIIVKAEPEKKGEEKPKEGKEEKKADGDGKKEGKKGEDDGKKAEEKDGGGGGNGDEQPPKQEGGQEEGDPKLEMKKNEFFSSYYYPYYQENNHQLYYPGFVQESYGYPAYPPQTFSDENPNACSVM